MVLHPVCIYVSAHASSHVHPMSIAANDLDVNIFAKFGYHNKKTINQRSDFLKNMT